MCVCVCVCVVLDLLFGRETNFLCEIGLSTGVRDSPIMED